MVTRVLPPPCTGVKSQDWKLGFGKSLSIVRICDLTSLRSAKRIVFVIRNSNQGSDLAELQPASEGIPLLVPREKYSESLHKTVRRKTRTVMVGNVALGSEHPIRIQTMTTSDTKDVAGTVEEVMRIADRGADIVRITVQGKKEADACFEIKDKLVQLNYNIPLVADIHFAPSVALRVAECFDKIRVNPENFADRWSQFETIEYTEDEYQKELQHIEQVFTPLVEKCKKYGRAMRIGTKLGSLSDRIMSYYGDSPRGMVESAFEFARICRKLDYHNFVFSMKASNPVIMVQAYRLLVAEMYVHGWDYPLHLGDTEAGEGEDGRMKSAIGIGTLLQDGLGDTISVSLTEPPEEEIDPCRRLANLGTKAAELQQGVAPFEEKHRHYFDFQPVQKEGEEVDYRGVLHRDGSVLMSISLDQLKAPELLYRSLATKLVVGKPFKDLPTVDSVLLRELPPVVHPATEAYTQEATEAIKSEKVIAVPTDTLYGFACDACSLEAVNRIYEIKGRKLTSPLAICVGDVLDIKRVATTNHLPHGLLDSLLPGPVTLILHRGDSSILEKSLNPGIDTIGVRVPDCEFIREVSRGSGSVLALTSANLSGDRSSVCVNDFENLWQHCAYVYDGGLLPSGRAGSTIIDLTKAGKYKIIRPGSSKQATVAILGKYMLEEEEEDG